MEKNNVLRLLNGKGEELCSLECVTYYDENNEFDEGETFYIHPLTGSQCDTVSQCLNGWSEQNTEDNELWDTLVNSIAQDDDLSQKIWNLDKIDYIV